MKDIPFIESADSKNYASQFNSSAKLFNRDGYLVLDLGLDEDFTARLKDRILQAEILDQQESIYHYSKSPRIFEAWKDVKEVWDLAFHPQVISTLEYLYASKPIPFQTINFIKGTNQPLHSDVIHFYTEPERWMAGVWVALEDITEESGPLCFCPASHRLPAVFLHHLNLRASIYGEQQENYRVYEQYVKNLVAEHGFEAKPFLAKRGQAIIWAANMLHGGMPVLDDTKTRWSQATHYFFSGCRHYYSPMFSNVHEDHYAEKNLDKLICAGLERSKDD